MREPDGFAAFVAARSPALVRTARLLTGDHAAAEDLVQHALARTWPRWSRLRDPAAGEAYVRKVLVTSYATSRRRAGTASCRRSSCRTTRQLATRTRAATSGPR
jgi:DNA-directed RNA polymerase specialized sigma24 family protein